MTNVLKPVYKSVLIPLGLIEAASAASAQIHKNVIVSETTSLIISNEEMEQIAKKLNLMKNPIF